RSAVDRRPSRGPARTVRRCRRPLRAAWLARHDDRREGQAFRFQRRRAPDASRRTDLRCRRHLRGRRALPPPRRPRRARRSPAPRARRVADGGRRNANVALVGVRAPIDDSRPVWEAMGVFLIPLMLSNILQSISATANSIFIGRAIGVSALAAISAFFPLL